MGVEGVHKSVMATYHKKCVDCRFGAGVMVRSDLCVLLFSDSVKAILALLQYVRRALEEPALRSVVARSCAFYENLGFGAI